MPPRSPALSAVKEDPDAPFRPDTLFLTWQRRPDHDHDRPVGRRRAARRRTRGLLRQAGRAPLWKVQPTTARPYPKTDFKVFRAELTGLTPGTEYQFRIGKHSPTYRFRTMPAKATDAIHFISGGDCGVNAHAVANNIQAARQDPMFALIGGDLGYDDGKSVDDRASAFLRNYSRTHGRHAEAG